jgi:hypothetical protein
MSYLQFVAETVATNLQRAGRCVEEIRPNNRSGCGRCKRKSLHPERCQREDNIRRKNLQQPKNQNGKSVEKSNGFTTNTSHGK